MLAGIRFLVALIAICLTGTGIARAQGPDEKPASNTSQASATSPGAAQEFLAKRAGEYTRAIKFMGQPGEWAGTSKISVVLGGRFIMEENRDTVMGRPVEGIRVYGYNNVTKQWEAATMYTMSTAITKLTGTSDDGGKTVGYSSESDEPRGNVPLRVRVRQIDDDHFVMTLSTTGPDGKEMPFQETTYTRKK